ncbi:hypothetical protein GCM10008957_54350 [Deinococcus ruber]|uniref:Uncharacterized protein n=1 Tax=Deinococcus ruber TaxID=1848197 RepID=A0A918FHM7_9DEIO|nr:hypothetical protein GCM10008957_54350 [Deinococcus ruber]
MAGTGDGQFVVWKVGHGEGQGEGLHRFAAAARKAQQRWIPAGRQQGAVGLHDGHMDVVLALRLPTPRVGDTSNIGIRHGV